MILVQVYGQKLHLTRWLARASRILCAAIVCLGLARGALAAKVILVLPPGDAYKEVVDQIKTLLVKQGHTCVMVALPGAQPEAPTTQPASSAPATQPASTHEDTDLQLVKLHPEIVVAPGANAVACVLKALPGVPVVFCMVPNALDRPFLAPDAPQKSQLAGVTPDVAPEAQIEWIHCLDPKLKRLAVLCSDNSRRTADSLVKPAREKGVTVVSIAADKNKFSAALQALSDAECDGVLMIADAYVYNSTNAQALLLWGLRGRKPVWTFSANLTKRGAFAAIYADPGEVPAQVISMVEQLVKGEKPVRIGLQYPRVVQRAVSEQTADQIGISLDKSSLTDALKNGKE